MQFVIERVSKGYENKPCEEAFKKDVVRIDVRSYKSFDEYDKTLGGKNHNWLDEGKNHCIREDGRIQREFEGKEWCIEINTLEELLNFCKNYHDLIIRTANSSWTIPTIIIYDGYIE